MTPETKTLLDFHTRAMAMAGLKNPERCQIEFDVFKDEDTGMPAPYWTINLVIPNKDKRRLDDKVRGSGDTLDLALEDLRARLVTHDLLKEGTA